MTTLTKNNNALSKMARRVGVGDYFALLEENEIGIYRVRRDNVKISPIAHYVGSLDNRAEAEGLVRRLNNREMNSEQLQEYLEKREDDEMESKAFVGNSWAYPTSNL